jgi:Ca2+-transporting ATPase
LGCYQYAVQHGFAEDLTRSMVFTSLVVANIFLTLVNRSFYFSLFTSLGYKNWMLQIIIFSTLVLLLCLLYIPFISSFFQLQRLDVPQLGISALIGFVSVIWFELYKWRIRSKS